MTVSWRKSGGSSGLIGGVVIRTLGDKYTFTGLDRAQPPDAPDIPTTVADVSNFDAIRPAFDGIDAVVHLAADAGMQAPWESVLPNNIVATADVNEAVIGVYEATRGYGTSLTVAADTPVYTRLTSTSGTVGRAEVMMQYEANTC